MKFLKKYKSIGKLNEDSSNEETIYYQGSIEGIIQKAKGDENITNAMKKLSELCNGLSLGDSIGFHVEIIDNYTTIRGHIGDNDDNSYSFGFKCINGNCELDYFTSSDNWWKYLSGFVMWSSLQTWNQEEQEMVRSIYKDARSKKSYTREMALIKREIPFLWNLLKKVENPEKLEAAADIGED